MTSNRQVALTFVKGFYEALAQRPGDLSAFYGEDSSFSRPERPEDKHVIVGSESIKDFLASRVLSGRSKIAVHSLDVQESLAGSILVIVIGELTLFETRETRAFTQTFLLAPQTPRGYFVRNDVFRFLHAESPDVTFPAQVYEQQDHVNAPVEEPEPRRSFSAPVAPTETVPVSALALSEPIQVEDTLPEGHVEEAPQIVSDAIAQLLSESLTVHEVKQVEAVVEDALAAVVVEEEGISDSKPHVIPSGDVQPEGLENREADEILEEPKSWAARLFGKNHALAKAFPPAPIQKRSLSSSSVERKDNVSTSISDVSTEPRAPAESKIEESESLVREEEIKKDVSVEVEGVPKKKLNKKTSPSPAGRRFSLFVAGIPEGATAEHLSVLFDGFGSLQQIDVPRSGDIAFVHYSSKEARDTALASGPFSTLGKVLDVKEARFEGRPRFQKGDRKFARQKRVSKSTEESVRT